MTLANHSERDAFEAESSSTSPGAVQSEPEPQPGPRGARAEPFADTLLALEVEQRRHRLRGVGALLGVAVAAWTAWAFAAEVQVYAIATSARIEGRGIHPVMALDSGRLGHSRIELGLSVGAGEVLAELDQSVESKEVDEATARHAAFAPRILALREELGREEALAQSELQAAEAVQLAARSRLRQARRALAVASERHRRYASSRPAATEFEVLDSAAEVDARRSLVAAAAAEVDQTGHERQSTVSAAQARRDRLRQELFELEGLERAAGVAREVAEKRLDRRRVRATHAGEIVERSGVVEGQVVQAGDRLATLMSGSSLHVIGEYPPGDAVGRIQPGQEGTLRLAGFPWARHGTVPCRVERVAAEPTNGFTRVELELAAPGSSSVPLQHGLVGTLEIAVERRSPAELFLIMLGDAVRSPDEGGR